MVQWIEVKSDSPELRDLAVQYELHPLALEDCLHRDQRPKLDDPKPSQPAGMGSASEKIRLLDFQVGIPIDVEEERLFRRLE